MKEMKEAQFGGKFLALNDDGFVMMALVSHYGIAPNQGMQFTSTLAMPLRDAFLFKMAKGWRFIAGVNEGGCRVSRSTITDTAPGADDRAASMHSLGIPILSIEDATENVKKHGIGLIDITRE
ncbi:MAG: hypothetical protein Q7T74_06910 [Candidatus Saccharibacteria bacterium]|nr:hypothetical protein [Candidatus Saccharibacteria bacterium]